MVDQLPTVSVIIAYHEGVLITMHTQKKKKAKMVFCCSRDTQEQLGKSTEKEREENVVKLVFLFLRRPTCVVAISYQVCTKIPQCRHWDKHSPQPHELFSSAVKVAKVLGSYSHHVWTSKGPALQKSPRMTRE